MSQALAKLHESRSIADSLPCWTGTMAAYVDPRKMPGKAVEYTDKTTGVTWIFPVPEAFQKNEGIILVAEHPDYSLEKDGNARIVRATQVDAIQWPRFREDYQYLNDRCDLWDYGAYNGDPVHDIPTGDSIEEENADARWFSRMDKRELNLNEMPWVGPIARGIAEDGHVPKFLRLVYLGVNPSNELGMAVESPDSAPHLSLMKKMLFEEAVKSQGVLLSGVSIDEFRALLQDANADVATLSQVLKPESLEGIRRFLEVLEEKE